ncbi:MAG: hypothetical protein WD929_04615 [Steroidobacteraceae bacterium]
MKNTPCIQSCWKATPKLIVTLVGIIGCASTPARTEVVPTLEQVATASTPAAAPDKAAENPFPGTTMRTGPNGEQRYCVKEVETGQRIAKERCYTQLTMEQMKESQRERIEAMRENSTYGTSGGP